MRDLGRYLREPNFTTNSFIESIYIIVIDNLPDFEQRNRFWFNTTINICLVYSLAVDVPARLSGVLFHIELYKLQDFGFV